LDQLKEKGDTFTSPVKEEVVRRGKRKEPASGESLFLVKYCGRKKGFYVKEKRKMGAHLHGRRGWSGGKKN